MSMLRTLGKNPSGKALEPLLGSPNFRDGSFQNLSETAMMLREGSMLKMMWKFFTKPGNTTPPAALPCVKTDLKNLPDGPPVIVWFGHSSYLIKIMGRHVLVDPVFSGHASPFSFTTKCFEGANHYQAAQMPEIDLLILSHDHYDHLDYETLAQLKGKVKKVCTSLGVGSHLVYWGWDSSSITELDWWQPASFEGLALTAAPARHFSGRSFTRGKTFWSSFVLQAGGYRIYLGADSGYDAHFKVIGDKFGPFDLAILECGQYNEMWPLIHMIPEQTIQASKDLQAAWLMPVHWGKFSISLHPWDEPIKRITKAAEDANVKLVTPLIGQPLILDEVYPTEPWWLNLASPL